MDPVQYSMPASAAALDFSRLNLEEIRWLLLCLLDRCRMDVQLYHQLLSLLQRLLPHSAMLHPLCVQLAFATATLLSLPQNMPRDLHLMQSGAKPSSTKKQAATHAGFRLDDYIPTHVLELVKDPHGSRFIQEKMETFGADMRQTIFDELTPEMCPLMNHKYANYVVQKYFEIGSDEQKLFLVQTLQGHVLYLTLQTYGCRVIQKAVETLPPEFQAEIISELDGHMLECVRDGNGNHVIQKCIRCADPILLQSMISSFEGKFYEMAIHPFGCRVVQRILENGDSKTLQSVLPEMLDHVYDLALDRYGNYIIQHILMNGSKDKKSEIISALQGYVHTLSQHKSASNVVEKCLANGSPEERSQLIQRFYEHDDSLLILMKDRFANYVLQRAIEVAQPHQRKLLVSKMEPYLKKVSKYTYAKHVVTKVDHIVAQGTC